MLAKYYRFILKNSSGQTMTYDNAARLALRLSPWKITSGALAYGAAITDDFGFGAGETIANLATVESTVIDNTSNLYLGINGFISVLHDHASADGVCKLYIEESDDNTNWPSDQTIFDPDLHAHHVCTLDVDNSADDQSFGMNFSWGA
jgi:hypothetical protein